MQIKAQKTRPASDTFALLAGSRPAFVIGLAAVIGAYGTAFAQTQGWHPGKATLAFTAAGTNEFTFNTGVLKGKLRADGKSTGLSSVVHLPTGLRLDSSMGLFGHYRVFSASHRYGTAAWFWPSQASLRPDGSVHVRWPSTSERPFELGAVYRWAAPDTLDLETTVLAKTNLPKFESFLASYFAPWFTNARVCVRADDRPQFETADQAHGVWQAFPRDDQAAAIIPDGRWKFPPNPVDWALRPPLAKPVAVRRCPANNLEAILMSPLEDCFAILTPFETEPHHSMYLSLFGLNLKAGQRVRAKARLIVTTNLDSESIERLYSAYLQRSR